MSGRYVAEAAELGTLYPISDLGKGLRLLSRNAANLSRKRADEILGLEEFVGDRKLRPRHVDNLVQQMKRGTFHPEQVQIITCVCRETDREYRMNGQHTAWARLEMDDSYPCQVQFLKYEAQTIADMRRLYATIDRGSPRTRSDVVHSYLAGTAEYGHFTVWSVRAIARGLSFYLWTSENERKAQDGDDVSYLLMTDYLEVGQKVAAFLDSCKGHSNTQDGHGWLFRQSVAAAMIATFQASGSLKALDEFWSGVRDGVGLNSLNDPRLRLRNALQAVAEKLGTNSDTNGKVKNIAAEQVYDWCIRCWNAFRKGEEIQVLKRQLPEERRKVNK